MGKQKISIYPNPVKSRLTVKITNLAETQTANLEMFSLSGSSMFKKEKITGSTEVDMSELPKGKYILKIVLGKEAGTWKIIKE